jgi:type I restriction enzyme, S subunit
MSTESPVRWVPVRDLGEVRMGKQLSPTSRAAARQFPYLRVANVRDGHIEFGDVKTMGFSASEREVYALHPGDILLNEGQEDLRMVGRSALYSGPKGAFFFQNTLIRFRSGPEILPEYAQAVFSHWRLRGVFANVAEKTSISHLGSERFASLRFPLIPIAEQRRTVELIDAMTTRESALRRKVDKLRRFAHGVLDGLLDGYPWNNSLRDAADGTVRNGFSPVPSQSWTGVRMLGLSCLTPDGFRPLQLKNAPEGVRADHVATLRSGDVLVSRANTRDLVGLAGVYEDIGSPCIYPDLMMRIRTNKKCLPHFLTSVLLAPRVRRGVRSMAQGSSESMVKISSGTLCDLAIPLPTVDQQKDCIERMSTVWRVIDAELGQLGKLQRLKQGLMESQFAHRQ